MSKPIFIVGFMGSGKTTWGKKLAKALQRTFIDLDEQLVEHVGMTIPAYFSLYGEEEFRKVESQLLKKNILQNVVISTGGGTPCFYDNMDWIVQHGTVVYLEHSPKSLWARLNASDVNKRPALKGLTGDKLLQFITEKLDERAPHYQKAHIAVDQLHTSIPELTAILLQQK
ncbi:shikimate kinase [Sphingobacterium sp. lm-10]|uniref:shikimate kinase n=1 Tax=Sphingobacterium sp. lm-10 TaxID=2944904 RepID=UPI002020EACC|nr:shikimate kinase [Sphingobacterium sp. lm-10]MCL7987917.1 shikimate kinase [Sphingobacterium sp. lm-10]